MKFKTIIKNWKTSILGLIPLLAGLLTITGIISISPEQVTAVTAGVNKVSETLISGQDLITGILEMAVGLGLIFTKDGDKTSEELGIK